MYVHAYQSYMWNKAASERVRRHGLSRPVAGDLIVDDSMLQYAGEDDGDIFSRVREVTAKEAASGAFKITDVVLPLPGNRVIYSESLKSLYEEILQERRGAAHWFRAHGEGIFIWVPSWCIQETRD
jgi:tRNA pseudouridine13 synthase